MPGTADPILIVDRKDFAPEKFDLGKATRLAQDGMRDLARALREKGYTVPDDWIPSEEVTAGQVSNISAWLFNESRRAKEITVDLTATPTNRATVLQWIKQLDFHNGTYSLSVGTHYRAAIREFIGKFAEANGVEHFMLTVPPGAEESIAPDGILSQHLGKIRTSDEWHAIAKEVNRDRDGLSLIFSLGLHHNDPTFLAPIPIQQLAAFQQVAADYRKRLMQRLHRRRERDDGGGA